MSAYPPATRNSRVVRASRNSFCCDSVGRAEARQHRSTHQRTRPVPVDATPTKHITHIEVHGICTASARQLQICAGISCKTTTGMHLHTQTGRPLACTCHWDRPCGTSNGQVHGESRWAGLSADIHTGGRKHRPTSSMTSSHCRCFSTRVRYAARAIHDLSFMPIKSCS